MIGSKLKRFNHQSQSTVSQSPVIIDISRFFERSAEGNEGNEREEGEVLVGAYIWRNVPKREEVFNILWAVGVELCARICLPSCQGQRRVALLQAAVISMADFD